MQADKKVGRLFTRLYVEKALIICHGLPYEPGSVVEKGYSELAKFFSENGIPTLIFDFSGTGLSDGFFSLKAWVEDLLTLCSNFDEVFVVGYSMGGAIGVRVAAEVGNVKKLAAVAPPCCAKMFGEDILRLIYENARLKNLLKGLGSFETFKSVFLKEFVEIEPKEWIREVKCDKLFVHGRKDSIVPFESSLILFELAGEPKTFIEVEDGDHFLRRNEKATRAILEWLKEKVKEKRVKI